MTHSPFARYISVASHCPVGQVRWESKLTTCDGCCSRIKPITAHCPPLSAVVDLQSPSSESRRGMLSLCHKTNCTWMHMIHTHNYNNTLHGKITIFNYKVQITKVQIIEVGLNYYGFISMHAKDWIWGWECCTCYKRNIVLWIAQVSVWPKKSQPATLR